MHVTQNLIQLTNLHIEDLAHTVNQPQFAVSHRLLRDTVCQIQPGPPRRTNYDGLMIKW
jgi:hypothetical protein